MILQEPTRADLECKDSGLRLLQVIDRLHRVRAWDHFHGFLVVIELPPCLMGRKMGVLSSSTPPLVLLGSIEFRQLFALVNRVREPQRLGAIISQTMVLQAEKTPALSRRYLGRNRPGC